VRKAAAEVEALGYGALWIPEAFGREVLTNASLLLHATRRLPIATGIANIWGRDPFAMVSAQRTLTEAFPDRFLLGLGVSHQPLVEGLRGHRYDRPLSTMRAYLDAMDAAPYQAPQPAAPLVRCIGALAPKMLMLAAERTWGAHPYFLPVEHTREARGILGPRPLLAPEQAVILETDADKARAIARRHMQTYLALPNYVRHLDRFGFQPADLEGGGSDRLVDAIVAWGDVDAVVKRVRARHEAGADHVCVQVLDADPQAVPIRQWRTLAPALLG
jgi:probable F420-dependent oxidoreductase